MVTHLLYTSLDQSNTSELHPKQHPRCNPRIFAKCRVVLPLYRMSGVGLEFIGLRVPHRMM